VSAAGTSTPPTDGASAANPARVVNPVAAYKNIINNTRVDVDDAYATAQEDGGSGRLLSMPSPGEQAYHYLLIYTIGAPSLGGLSGNYADDNLRGIYHFGIGKNQGILKRVQFSKADFSLREARIERELLQGATGLAILANVYDVKVTMFGNTLFIPGSMIFIDPTGLGAIGSPTNPESPARILGIGGYHKVYNVQSYIESGKYETVIDAIWEAPGDTSALDEGVTRFEHLALASATGAEPGLCPDGSRPRSLTEEE
jgi:hypothetical protein